MIGKGELDEIKKNISEKKRDFRNEIGTIAKKCRTIIEDISVSRQEMYRFSKQAETARQEALRQRSLFLEEAKRLLNPQTLLSALKGWEEAHTTAKSQGEKV